MRLVSRCYASPEALAAGVARMLAAKSPLCPRGTG